MMTRVRKTCAVLLFLAALVWQGKTTIGDELSLVIEGPTGSGSNVEGTFRVTLDHVLGSWEPYEGYFEYAFLNLPIVGDGFVVSNVHVPSRDSGGIYHDPDATFVTWQRSFFDDEHVSTHESEIHGEILSFDVHFEDGITEGSYTIGTEDFMGIGRFAATFYEGKEPRIALDGLYHDNWGGRTFSIPEPTIDGDMDGDGDIDDVDLNLFLSGVEYPLSAQSNANLEELLDNFGRPNSPTEVTVPEPSGLLLLCLGGLGLLAVGRAGSKLPD